MTRGREKTCAESVYDRSGWGPHHCANKGVVQVKGKWYCRVHDPAAVAARRAKRDARYGARQRRDEQAQKTAERLAKRLGVVGHAEYSAIGPPSRHGFVEQLVISFPEAVKLADRLEQLEKDYKAGGGGSR